MSIHCVYEVADTGIGAQCCVIVVQMKYLVGGGEDNGVYANYNNRYADDSLCGSYSAEIIQKKADLNICVLHHSRDKTLQPQDQASTIQLPPR